MATFDRGKQRLFFSLAIVGVVILLVNLFLLAGTDVPSTIKKISIPYKDKSGQDTPPDPNYSLVTQLPKLPSWHHDNSDTFEELVGIDDQHPISELMKKGDEAWNQYEESRSMTFGETVRKYRKTYGRHPPPGFREWYKFARERAVHNVDDFTQIMDDLRPFWGVEPAEIRSLAAHMHENDGDGVSGLHIRDGKVWKLSNLGWRIETMAKMVEPFVKKLPDMDIAMNRLDQPRVVVPWDDMQKLLAAEEKTRRVAPDALAEWSTNMTGFWKDQDPAPSFTDAQWFRAPGSQYMNIAKEGCPPESHARDGNSSVESAEATYKIQQGGFVTNFNLSSDLCTIGPEIQDKHGFLYASSSIVASKRLLPIFGECKVNVNNDILFPANMYYKDDDRYEYDPKFDYDWDDKHDRMIWRGVTSGGTNTVETYKNMHRHRLVLLSNGTVMGDEKVRIMTQDTNKPGVYNNYDDFGPGEFALKHTDVGFTEAASCVPDCHFYDDVFSFKNITTLGEQFESKFLVDVDGHSFSGRWHAFLQSKSLGIKATIFREWHDSRLFAWRHFVPLDNRYDELYSILTYFIGLGKPGEPNKPYIQRHSFEGRKLGRQGKEWATKVLRKEDIEIYMYRLLLEYARLIDDNRDMIGYSGDGSELDKYDAKNPMSVANGGHA
ncbi:Beta-1,2-xylosyltransferase [Lachnellula hyalina]|uniref:Beta-1,2-xylosyltransferase n=1 Tax=Lachnellula hyalina TaxID=1316788 RepID=A0A8H8R8B1_9HELO|nr:Beta-1,2-xylosyltransferase [Lachnellula hyalina]TVY29452.1 Beta-1,2-xylosyltransferase [Lachnellula hyalina]